MVQVEQPSSRGVHAEAEIGQRVEVRIQDGVRTTGMITALDPDAQVITITLDEPLDGTRIITVGPDDVTVI